MTQDRLKIDTVRCKCDECTGAYFKLFIAFINGVPFLKVLCTDCDHFQNVRIPTTKGDLMTSE